jgi:hypothetical protein
MVQAHHHPFWPLFDFAPLESGNFILIASTLVWKLVIKINYNWFFSSLRTCAGLIQEIELNLREAWSKR